VPTNELVLGKHSGRHALALRYEELGYPLNSGELDGAYRRFTELADRKKRIYDQDLISLIAVEAAVPAETTTTAEREQWARTVAA
jgi:2-isopropylmalate synthase